MKKIRIAVTIGDPSGVGPEIAAKLALDEEINRIAEPVFIGYRFIMEHAFKKILGRDIPEDIIIEEPDATEEFELIPGTIRGEYGKASMMFIEKGVDMCMSGNADALCTCPINKKAIQLGGYPYPGHTEFLGYLTRSTSFSMLLVGEKIRSVLATTHHAIAEVPEILNEDKIITAVTNAHKAGPFFVGREPRIAVCGLNPHAGDNGALGIEEQTFIKDAIRKLRRKGIDIDGPLPADSVYPKALKGEYDFVVAMYHDQGMIPVKMEAFGEAVNVTLNLPIVRTSVDHGTAFDIAGKNTAGYSSLKKAFTTAVKMVENARSA
ncbi:4-hydroxythreonine-4-phosphate dehydrogenase PdxA [Limisalsivibrio acetivorans]|uniref:4-hydroxythreonine-4-phosphate dehydrogenase PdxA n=1 Tax=Limisalsivibrio acetivorans TaxID=1304888 RepID=UPI0003B49E91|nr:4-hydroxythreonine-4-phosphate dehydrogenase PdxA [Limisalsivibrio acetivorans]